MCIGFEFLPNIIYDMYAMMYTTPSLITEFNMYYAVIGLLAAGICTVGATIFSLVKELKQVPASLMRPKSPKPGKRVLLERVNFIWSRLKFSRKVTVRNIFRYKKRFLMTIVGIMGCTSLIFAGFGIRDSVSYMIPSQYGEIFKYQMSVEFKSKASTMQIDKCINYINELEQVTNTLKLNIQSIDIIKNDNDQDIKLIVPEDSDRLNDFIELKSRVKSDTYYKLDDSSIILTEKISNLLDIKKGDTIKIKNSDDIIVEVKVGEITENYLLHYIYMSPNLYKQLFNENINYNSLFAITNELTETQENDLGKQILSNDGVISSISFNSSTKDMFSDVMNNLTYVVWILIISAGLLAFVVLYNLSNININERIRELASLKVLGFYDKEVYKYISRETVILTIIGIILGLAVGYFLNMFIIKTCELDMFMFDKRVNILSFVYSVVITAFFTAVVNIVTYFALKKINMIDSLKSVE